jgi:hypothetical protein
MIDELCCRVPDGTEFAVIERAFGVAHDLKQFAVLHVHQRAAAAVATSAHAFEDLDVSRNRAGGLAG